MARILALSSHVAFGSVGLAATVPALHWLGHEVIALPTVVLSNHPGYARFAGEPIAPDEIEAMLDALEANGWLAGADAVLTGYLPSAAHVAVARSAVERVRRANRGAVYLCDPVFGDDPGGLYLAEATAAAIRDDLIPQCSIATPNRFELSWLAGAAVDGPEAARDAARGLALPAVLATSIPASDNRLGNVLVMPGKATACTVRRRDTAPHGTGDLLAALYLGRILNGEPPAAGLAAAAAGVEVSIAASMGRDELPLASANALWAGVHPLPTAPV